MTLRFAQRVLFRCDGGRMPELGTGHLRRCLTLARCHWREYGTQAWLLMREDAAADALVRDSGAPVEVLRIEADDDEQEALERALERVRPHVCVFDRLDIPRSWLDACRRSGVISVTLDDAECGPGEADIAVNAIRAHPATPYQGPEYLVLPEVDEPVTDADRNSGIRLLVSAGGYDHGALAPRLVRALAALPEISRVRVVAADAELSRRCAEAGTPRCAVDARHAVPSLAPLLRESDIAVVSGGLTLFEAMRLGVPPVAVAQYPHQAATAKAYEALNAAVSVGMPDAQLEQRVKEAVRALIECPERRRILSRQGRRLIDGRGLRRVAELLRVCEFLEWDTEFFGARIATLRPLRLSEPILAYAFDRCRDWRVDCLYYQCDCHHPETVKLAERYGFHFVDIRLTFMYDLRGARRGRAEPAAAFTIRPSRPEDTRALAEIASESYLDSRYYFDQRFPRERCAAFYTEWVEKYVRHSPDQLLVAESGGAPIGYVACGLLGPFVGNIDLLGVHAGFRGSRVGSSLVRAAVAWFRGRDIDEVQVVTQGRNYAAQRLYQRCGFVTKQTHLWYHKWFDR